MTDTKGERILIVDDEAIIRDTLSDQLELLNYSCQTVDNGQAAIKITSEDRFDLILLDINMPEMSGFETLEKLHGVDDGVPIVMVSGGGSTESVRTTLRNGAYDYLSKPWEIEELKITIKRALDYGRLTRENKNYQKNLEKLVGERTRELKNALGEIKSTYQTTILALGSALETRDVETQAHALRVAHYSFALAENMGMKDQRVLTDIEWGAYLHDIGKIGVPDSILRKPGSLSDEEWIIMKKHPEIGKRMIEGIQFLNGTIPIVHGHHERFDGAGYPGGLKMEDIPIDARIFSVADALDAMLSDRPYRKAMAFSKAISIVESETGKQFDPRVTESLLNIPEERLLRQENHFTHILAQQRIPTPV